MGKGKLTIELEDGTVKVIGVNRAHLEEDAGQSSHEGWPQSREKSYVNLNRAGIPLLEIVSEPDIRSAEEAYAYLTELKTIVQYLDICDGNMEEGSMRCDANVSVRPVGQKEFGTRTEIKNLNSFNNVRRGIQYEIERQITLITQGEEVEQCTLLWDDASQSTRVMRTKEDSQDYRYFPEPDLPSLVISEAEVDQVRQTMPELPRSRYLRFMNQFGLPKQDARLLASDRVLAEYFEETAQRSQNPKASANWIMGELLRDMKQREGGMETCPITPQQLARLVSLIGDKTISGKIGKEVFAEMFKTSKDPDAIVEEKGLRQITDEGALTVAVSTILTKHPDQVADYKAGKTKIFGFFVGQVMKATRGKANPDTVNRLLRDSLNK